MKNNTYSSLRKKKYLKCKHSTIRLHKVKNANKITISNTQSILFLIGLRAVSHSYEL